MPRKARLGFGRVNVPQLFDTDRIGLRILTLAQIEPVKQGFGQMAATALSKNSLFGMKFHATHKAVSGGAVLADSHIAGGDAFYCAGRVIQHLGRGKPRINFNPHRLGLFAKPATEITKRNDKVAMIVHAWWGWQTHRPRFRQIDKLVRRHWRVQRRAAILPVRKQLVQTTRFQHRTRQNMRANFTAFFNQTDRYILTRIGGQLL